MLCGMGPVSWLGPGLNDLSGLSAWVYSLESLFSAVLRFLGGIETSYTEIHSHSGAGRWVSFMVGGVVLCCMFVCVSVVVKTEKEAGEERKGEERLRGGAWQRGIRKGNDKEVEREKRRKGVRDRRGDRRRGRKKNGYN